jgi:5-methylcytosine-specific restriction endonuclease McrA
MNIKEIEEKQTYDELFGINPKNILDKKEKENIISEDRARYRKQNKKWCINHPKYHNMVWQKRRAKKLSLPYTLTSKQWQQIKEYFNNKCAYCGKELPLSKEHFIPLSKGGEYTINNIIPVCLSCNSSKQDKDFFKWYPAQSFYSKAREKRILKYLGYKNDKQQLKIG